MRRALSAVRRPLCVACRLPTPHPEPRCRADPHPAPPPTGHPSGHPSGCPYVGRGVSSPGTGSRVPACLAASISQ
ncbi:hypothetical protein D9753_10430 [Streptomyces dangxiongensis]|uniref:Uncharacterized protein n=1 Tax=Streptomyces dangxiongensis TaxID=1442032 RepID=A0A3G2JAC2_9ACTN|nr:hypothetical protein D9753_10430 [Streptomyces dangxiongensis]